MDTTTNTPIVFDKKIHTKISTSSIQTLDQCPRKYFYRYVKKLYPDVAENDAAVFGNFVHDVAEHFTGGSLAEFKKLVKDTLPNYDISDKYRVKLAPALKNLYVYISHRFKIDDVIDRERKIEIPYKNKYFVTGKIDVLHARGNTVTVIDWKTAKAEKDHSFQLSFYMFLLDLMNIIKIDSLNCEIVYLCADDHDNNLYSSKYTIEKDDVESAVSRIESLIRTCENLGEDEIRWRKKIGPLCNYCDYKHAGICNGTLEEKLLVDNKNNIDIIKL